MDFIFMLTRDDRTVPDAMTHAQAALALGVSHIGFKDIGAPVEDLKKLNAVIQDGGARSYLEVVSLDRDSEMDSIRAAVEIGVDVLLGGTHVAEAVSILEGTGIAYYPFPGRITGHPSRLEGGIEDIVASARSLAAHPGVHGLDLLAYRADVDVPDLMAAICAAIDLPVIMAGSIDCPDRIAAAKQSGATGFTIGTAILTERFEPKATTVPEQIKAVLHAI